MAALKNVYQATFRFMSRPNANRLPASSKSAKIHFLALAVHSRPAKLSQESLSGCRPIQDVVLGLLRPSCCLVLLDAGLGMVLLILCSSILVFHSDSTVNFGKWSLGVGKYMKSVKAYCPVMEQGTGQIPALDPATEEETTRLWSLGQAVERGICPCKAAVFKDSQCLIFTSRRNRGVICCYKFRSGLSGGLIHYVFYKEHSGIISLCIWVRVRVRVRCGYSFTL